MMARQCLAFQGSTGKLFQRGNGNFLKIIELLAEFDPIMDEHLRRVQNELQSKNWSITYLSNTIQDELIALLGNEVQAKVINNVKQSKYFSIIVDCTPDLSHREQLSLILRCVVLNETNQKYEIKEYFVGFFEATETTGQALTDLIIKKLNELGLDLSNIRGQGYDNGSNMKGVQKGVQNRILLMNPRAFFVPCACHSLCLVVNDAAACSGEVIGFFSIVQELYAFFSGSPKRWSVLMAELKEHSMQITLKPLSTTRWSSRINALKPLRYAIGAVYDALVIIAEDTNRDADTKNKARGLAKQIKDYKFICSIILWYDILFQVNKISLLMQSPEIDLTECANIMENVTKFLRSYRSDAFVQMRVAARELAEELEIEPQFKSVESIRPRRKKRHFSYEHQDESPITEEQKFEVNFFNFLVDVTLNSIEERFV